ncbi:Bax inhibitor-1/YccA family protein [Alloscardovia venturai]|uniref:Bax inhibitor-1/YccA family protein n=1 Tax=Alloscardovia venturai TaxID=1769421 RepID=A0ABW2Y5A2_9BIFI
MSESANTTVGMPADAALGNAVDDEEKTGLALIGDSPASYLMLIVGKNFKPVREGGRAFSASKMKVKLFSLMVPYAISIVVGFIINGRVNRLFFAADALLAAFTMGGFGFYVAYSDCVKNSIIVPLEYAYSITFGLLLGAAISDDPAVFGPAVIGVFVVACLLILFLKMNTFVFTSNKNRLITVGIIALAATYLLVAFSVGLSFISIILAIIVVIVAMYSFIADVVLCQRLSDAGNVDSGSEWLFAGILMLEVIIAIAGALRASKDVSHDE